jgi:hypothetical protein
MSEEVGVDPGRLNELASALAHLREVLAANVPTIVGTLNQYWSAGQGIPVSLSPLEQARTRSNDDTANIQARCTMAIAWEDKQTTCLAHDMIAMPWLTSGQLYGTSEAELLKRAEAEAESDPNSPQARAEIMAVANAIKDHAGDSEYLAAFYNAAAPQVAALAGLLHDEDGGADVLSKQDAGILTTFAAGLATASESSNFNRAAVTKAFTGAQDLWSAGILFKYANGAAFANPNGTYLLAHMSRTMLSHAGQDSNLVAPFSDPRSDTQQQIAAAYKLYPEYDPVAAVIRAAAGDPAAAQEVLGGPGGRGYASDLLRYPWAAGGIATVLAPYTDVRLGTPGVDTSGAAAAFLNAATAAPGGVMNPVAAQAVVNIVHAADKLPAGDDLPEKIRQAFIGIAYRNVLGFGSTDMNDVLTNPVQPNPNGSGHYAEVSSSDLQGFLVQALQNPTDFGRFQASLNALVPGAVQATINYPGTDYLAYVANLKGEVLDAYTSANFSKNEQLAAQQAEQQMTDNMISAGLVAIPGFDELDGAAAVWQGLAAGVVAAGTPLAESQIPGGNLPQTLLTGDQEKTYEENAITPYIVQGLINAHEIPTGLLSQKNADGQPLYPFYNAATGTVNATDGSLQAFLVKYGGDSFGGQKLNDWISDGTQSINVTGGI